MGNYFYEYKFIAQVIGSFHDVELWEGVNRHGKRQKDLHKQGLCQKKIYLKKCVNCDNSEFPQNSITGQKWEMCHKVI